MATMALKVAALCSSVALAAGYVGYRAGAASGARMPPSAPPAATAGSEAHWMYGSKSAPVMLAEPAAGAMPPTGHVPSEPPAAPTPPMYFPGSKTAVIVEPSTLLRLNEPAHAEPQQTHPEFWQFSIKR